MTVLKNENDTLKQAVQEAKTATPAVSVVPSDYEELKTSLEAAKGEQEGWKTDRIAMETQIEMLSGQLEDARNEMKLQAGSHCHCSVPFCVQFRYFQCLSKLVPCALYMVNSLKKERVYTT